MKLKDRELIKTLIVFLDLALNVVQEYGETSEAVSLKNMPLYYDGRRLVARSCEAIGEEPPKR